MAKKQSIDPDLFAKTEAPPAKGDDPVKAVGVGLRASEWARLQAIADELQVSRHELAMFIMRDWLKRYEAGERPKTRTKKELVMPE